MSARNDYLKVMEGRLAMWRRRLATLVDSARADSTMRCEDEVSQWKAAGDRAAIKLEELRGASAAAWNTVGVEMESLWQKMEVSLGKGEARRRAYETETARGRPRLTLVPRPAEADAASAPGGTTK